MGGPSKRRCRLPHPTATWQGPGGVVEPYRCVEAWDHLGAHRAVCDVRDDQPDGRSMTWGPQLAGGDDDDPSWRDS